MDVIGIDNNMRQYFFGEEASTEWSLQSLVKNCPRFAPRRELFCPTELWAHAVGFTRSYAGMNPSTS